MYKCFVIPVTGFLIANLAVADLGVGLLCIPFTVVYYELNFRWPFGPIMCKILPALMPCFVMGSVGTMLAISVGKYRWFGCAVSLSISAEGVSIIPGKTSLRIHALPELYYLSCFLHV